MFPEERGYCTLYFTDISGRILQTHLVLHEYLSSSYPSTVEIRGKRGRKSETPTALSAEEND